MRVGYPFCWIFEAGVPGHRHRLPTLFLFFLLAALLPAGLSAVEELPRGTPLDAVVCGEDPEQSYALYLPSAYSRERRWPILYCFEPGARGPVPIQRFREAAEKYGYILVCSNNSRNGPWEPIKQALQAVWTDTQKRFSIDNTRIYSAGHSGGAIAALEFGFFLGRPWAGVVSCCGFLPSPELARAFPKDLVVFVTTGLYDFNYWPSLNISSALSAAGISNHLEVFPDVHTWLPTDVAMNALAWLELQAMKKGLKAQDEAWIASQFAEGMQRAQEIEQGGKPMEAYEAYRALASDFHGLVDTAQAESSAVRLGDPAEVEKHGKAMKAAEKEEAENMARTAGALEAFKRASTIRDRRLALDEMGIPALLKDARKEDGSAASLSARRVQGFLYGQAALVASQALGRSDLKAAQEYFELAVQVRPDSGVAWYNLACVHSRLGKKKDALRALETAVRNGMTDWETIEKDPDFEAIRGEPAFIRLLESLNKKPPYASG